MGDRKATTVKIGPRVPEGVWDDFKAYCKQKNGKQGTAGEELAKAMRNHMGEGEQAEADRLESQLSILNTKMDYLLNSVHTMEDADRKLEAPSR